MKTDIKTTAVFAVFLMLIPCLAYLSGKAARAGERAAPAQAEPGTVDVYITAEDRVVTYELEDYLTGAVLAQMPADFHPEALKVQAVLARTYIKHRRAEELKSPDPSLHGAVISDDETRFEPFFTPEQAAEYYGDGYKAACEKVIAAVRAAPEVLYFDGEPCVCAYHAASSGYTESAEVSWGVDIPYLQAAESLSDRELGGIETEVTFGERELLELMEKEFSVIALPEIKQNARGFVISVTAGGKDIPVNSFVSCAGLASPCFTMEQSGDRVTFTCLGFGHLVGVSQYGAEYMAENGAGYKDILAHYYAGAELR
ncbi:MAG: SpoIID/LytB domain-containing protein [Ruminococcus sp.]|nr:SpoIID/LytB domain-containing protein [Ruminococcus sp.]